MNPHFINPEGYVLHMIPGTDKFEFTLSPVAPLTWSDGCGREWQPDRHFTTDRGSFWDIISKIIRCSRNQLAFLFHDSGYKLVPGLGHGLYCRAEGFLRFTFHTLTRAELDEMCRRMLLSEGVSRTSARIVKIALRAAIWNDMKWGRRTLCC